VVQIHKELHEPTPPVEPFWQMHLDEIRFERRKHLAAMDIGAGIALFLLYYHFIRLQVPSRVHLLTAAGNHSLPSNKRLSWRLYRNAGVDKDVARFKVARISRPSSPRTWQSSELEDLGWFFAWLGTLM
jgi:hypothetical protein